MKKLGSVMLIIAVCGCSDGNQSNTPVDALATPANIGAAASAIATGVLPASQISAASSVGEGTAGEAGGEPVGPERGILFSVRDYAHSDVAITDEGKKVHYLIEPIAFVDEGKLLPLPDNLNQNQFDKVYYAGHHHYQLYSGGKGTGDVELLRSAFEVQCQSYAGAALVSAPELVSGNKMALASNAKFHGSHSRRAPTKLEEQAVRELAYQIYRENKVDKAIYEQATPVNISTVAGPSGTMVIAAYTAVQKVKQEHYDEEVVNAVFVIAEKNPSGKFEPGLTWFHSGAESDFQLQELVDVLDIDADGVPEVISQTSYYESVGYQVYKKADNKWTEIFEGFGGGC